MTKLIKANIFSLLKTKFFYALLLISAAAGGGFTILFKMFPDVNTPPGVDSNIDYSDVLGFAPNFVVLIVPFIVAAGIGLFMENEYTQGTIRNKFICGYTRGQVFFSYLIVMTLMTLLIFAVYELTAFGIAVLAMGYDKYVFKTTVAVVAVMFLMILATVTVLSTVVSSFFHGGKLVATLLGIQYGFEFFMIVGMYQNKHWILDLLSRIAPQGSGFTVNYVVIPEKLWINAVVSVCVIAVLLIFGYGRYKKSDIT